MKTTILLSSLLLGYAGLMVAAQEQPPKEHPLEELLRLHPEQFRDKLSDVDMRLLGRVNKSLHESVKIELTHRQSWISYLINNVRTICRIIFIVLEHPHT